MPEPSARLIRPREAAKILGISYSTLKRWIHTKQLRSVKTRGGHHRIPESELDRHSVPRHPQKHGGRTSGPVPPYQRTKSTRGSNYRSQDRRIAGTGNALYRGPAHHSNYHIRCCPRDASGKRPNRGRPHQGYRSNDSSQLISSRRNHIFPARSDTN